jgi:uncharacterized protein YecE (DUF72 family)
MSQFDLFGEPIPDSAAFVARRGGSDNVNGTDKQAKNKVGAASPSPLASSVAPLLDARLHLGTSSWSFSGWANLVYDDSYTETKLARDGLAAYAKHPLHRTVGIDRTFYAPISEDAYARYAAQVPEGFRFLIKAPMAITSSYVRNDDGAFADSPYFLDVEYAINEFVAPATAGLGAKAGPLVFQFPPQGRANTQSAQAVDRWINRLYRFLKELPPGFLYAVEIRDPELLTERFLTCLRAVGVRLCVASHANMPNPREQIAAMNNVLEPGPLVVRWSLHAGFKYADAKARYFPFNQLIDEDLDSRASIAAACLAAVEANHPAFVIINNKAEGSAPLSIEKLAASIVGWSASP